MKKRSSLVLLIVAMSLFFVLRPDIIFAGTTGKIIGKITDSQSSQGLPGVNIVLQGTTMGAASDADGNFLILNIPPGYYILRVTMVGYQTKIIENVRVMIDLTTTINSTLQQTVINAGEEITIVAERPLVQRDMTSSMSTVAADQISNLPVQNVTDVLELEAGVVQSGGLHIRGGRSGEIAYWVDGVATTDVFSGEMGMQVENASISELQVISGTFNAEYGQAMSGIINIVTKEGGRQYTGLFKGWVGDYVSTDSKFDVLKKVSKGVDPLTDRPLGVGTAENPLKKFNPNYNVEATLSGPIPFIGNKLSFFLNGRYVTDEGYLYGREWFKPWGQSGDSSLVPMNSYDRYSTQAKLTYRYNPNIKLSYNGFWNQSHQDRIYNQSYKYCPDGTPQSNSQSSTHIFTLNHVISANTFYDLKVNRFYRDYEQYVYENPYAMPDYLVKVYADTALGLPEDVFDPSTAEGQQKLEAYKLANRTYRYITDPSGPAGYVHPDSSQTPVGYSYVRGGQDLNHYYRSTMYWLAKLDLTSQVNRAHQIKFGVEARLNELTLDSYTIQKKIVNGLALEPFTPDVPSTQSIYHDQYNRKPREASAYFQDKIELQDIILNLGLRFDYFDANSVIPANPADPDIYYPQLAVNKYKNPGAPADQLVEYTPAERRAFMHKKVDPKTKLSPRLGIAYPITDQGVIHFSYGHFFQIPEFQYLYDSPDFKLGQSGGLTIVGNANLNPQKTVMYEIGLQQQVTQDIGIDVALFYRDVRDWVGTSPRIKIFNTSNAYVIYENKDYSNVRGVTLKIEKRYSHNFFANLDYSYQIAEGTYSNPDDAYNAELSQQEPRLAILPLNWDQNHTINASISYSNNIWTVSLIGRYWTGRPYSPTFPRGATIGTSTYSGLRENSARLPSVRGLDLYVNRLFNLGAMKFNLFVNVYNLFDIRDETAVYSDTGSADYTTLINTGIVDYDPRRVGTVEDYVNQPGWYTAPRQIQVGASIEF
jgi:hypothetical protein